MHSMGLSVLIQPIMPLTAGEREFTKWFTEADRFPVPIMFPVMEAIFTRMDADEKKEFLEAVCQRYLVLPHFTNLTISEDPEAEEAALYTVYPGGDSPRPVYVLHEPLHRARGTTSSTGPPHNDDWKAIWDERKRRRKVEGKREHITSPDRIYDQLPMIRELLLLDSGVVFSAAMRWFRAVDAVPLAHAEARRMIMGLVQLRILRRPQVTVKSKINGPLIAGRLESIGGDMIMKIRDRRTGAIHSVELHTDTTAGDDDFFNILHPVQQRALAYLRDPRIQEMDENVNALTLEMAGLASPRGFVKRRAATQFRRDNPRYAMPLLDPIHP